MTSDQAASSERHIYVGLAHGGGLLAEPVGLLKTVRTGVLEAGQFAYGRRYLQAQGAQALNPAHLPLREAPFDLAPRRLRDGGALPLTLRDALPDSWGRKVLETQHGKSLSDIDTLLLTNDDRVGAMVFSEHLPIPSGAPSAELLALQDLADASRRIEAGLEVTPEMERLLRGGSNLGGARPKATFVHDSRRYIAKFASRADELDVAVIEATTMSLARACGISVPPFHIRQLARGHALLVERFDRTGPLTNEFRLHYLSCSALLDVPYESSGGSYVEFAQALRRWSVMPERDTTELFRRIVFNLVVGNSDDHVKNHGILHQGHGFWRLAPAFDLVSQLDSHTDYQELAILPGRFESCLSSAREAVPHFGLREAEAEEIIQNTLDIVHRQASGFAMALHGDLALAKRFHIFLERQAERIAA